MRDRADLILGEPSDDDGIVRWGGTEAYWGDTLVAYGDLAFTFSAGNAAAEVGVGGEFVPSLLWSAAGNAAILSGGSQALSEMLLAQGDVASQASASGMSISTIPFAHSGTTTSIEVDGSALFGIPYNLEAELTTVDPLTISLSWDDIASSYIVIREKWDGEAEEWVQDYVFDDLTESELVDQ